MWKHCLLVVVLAAGCSSKDDGGDDNSGTGAGSGGVTGTGTGGTPGTGGSVSTGTGGATGTGGSPMLPTCPPEPGAAMCGTEACPAVSATLAMACVKSCCTTDNRCGTYNGFIDMTATNCMPPFVNTTMCPNETIMGNMVPGCCVMGTNECGIVNILTGMGNCIARSSPILAIIAPGLSPANCDGTTPMGTAGMTGTGGMMGTGGTGTGGTGTGGTGTGGTGTGGMMGTGGT